MSQKRRKTMGRNSKDNSLTRYEEILRISVTYHQLLDSVGPVLIISSVSRKAHLLAASYVRNVRSTLKKMNKSNRTIVTNEFFSKCSPDWWVKRYSRSSFYRKRALAIKSFLENYVPC